MNRTRASRLWRLERAATQLDRQSVPVAAVFDEDGVVLKLMGPDGEFYPAACGLMMAALPETVKLYGFDPECA